MKQDNSTFQRKADLRTRALLELARPVILETHGGVGKLFSRCYGMVRQGVVFEKDPAKVAQLGRQRPTWAVYECDCIRAISEGVGSHLPINFVDLDPYGDPWPVLDAFFSGHKPQVERLVLVVNDGLRQNLRLNGGWHCKALASVVDRIGNAALHSKYIEICQELVSEKSEKAGYRLSKWTGYYTGAGNMMTHYAAVLQKATK